MKILKFKLSGKDAFFKKPDVNSCLYFTYGNIHKVALLGLLGAVLGYGGYNSMNMKNVFLKKKNQNKMDFPEFYYKLKDLQISIEPLNEKGYIPKKVQIFNNSVGYASKEQGGNLIVKEQWLENPSWNIYILIDDEEGRKISEYIMEKKCVYTPYLGKNDHFADIMQVKIFDESKINIIEESEILNCLYLKDDFRLKSLNDDLFNFDEDNNEEKFKYEEKLPIALEETTNMYIMKSFIYTNMKVERNNEKKIYQIENKRIVFY